MERTIPFYIWIIPLAGILYRLWSGFKAFRQWRLSTSSDELAFGKHRWRFNIIDRWMRKRSGLSHEDQATDTTFVQNAAFQDLVRSIMLTVLSIFMLAAFMGLF